MLTRQGQWSNLPRTFSAVDLVKRRGRLLLPMSFCLIGLWRITGGIGLSLSLSYKCYDGVGLISNICIWFAIMGKKVKAHGNIDMHLLSRKCQRFDKGGPDRHALYCWRAMWKKLISSVCVFWYFAATNMEYGPLSQLQRQNISGWLSSLCYSSGSVRIGRSKNKIDQQEMRGGKLEVDSQWSVRSHGDTEICLNFRFWVFQGQFDLVAGEFVPTWEAMPSFVCVNRLGDAPG